MIGTNREKEALETLVRAAKASLGPREEESRFVEGATTAALREAIAGYESAQDEERDLRLKVLEDAALVFGARIKRNRGPGVDVMDPDGPAIDRIRKAHHALGDAAVALAEYDGTIHAPRGGT